MNIDVAVDGLRFSVSIDAVGSGEATVTVDGKRRVVNVAWIDSDTLSIIDGSVAREVRFHGRRENGAAGVEIAGVIHEATAGVELRGTPISLRVRGESAPGGTHVITAPMPGRVMRVLAAVGDRVNARQALVVVEAMKMENEIRAKHQGTVKEIHAVAGAAVEAGSVLIVITGD
jgi:biotin carboxyl carrier protein